MKSEEDEAFDNLAKKQGDWGGGFPAKRRMAVDKLQEPIYKITVFDNAHPKGIPLEDWVQPVSFPCCGYTDAIKWNQFNGVVQCHICGQVYTAAQPTQEPVARVTGVYGGRFTYEPINRAMVLPIGMALYAAPPAQESVAREWNFCERCGKRTADLTTIHTCTPPQEKSND